MIRASFAILLTLTISFSEGQTYNGYVITNDYDTIHGLIRKNRSALEEIVCQFSLSDSLKFYQYFPNELVGYGYKNKFFESKVLIEGDLRKRAFLQKLFQGEIDIYRDRGFFGSVKFYIDKPGYEMVSVPKPKVYDVKKSRGGKAYFVTQHSAAHKGLLGYFFADEPLIEDDLLAMETVSEKSLIDIATKYHELVCEPGVQCTVYYYEK